MNITSEEYRKWLKKPKKVKKSAVSIKKTGKDYKAIIWDMLRHSGLEWTTEHKFHPKRKWRFDWACKELKVAVEYEGIFGGKSRHTSNLGYVNDCSKYNAAQLLGWKVLRYTAMNYKDLENDLKTLADN